jgi:serine/threonine protein phosphatase 1
MRSFAISDIHGCSKTFQMLVKKIDLQKKDQLFLLGDYINKGPDSKGVLDFILDLQNKGYQLFPIKGNHDQMLIDAIKGIDIDSWFAEDQKQLTLKSFNVSSPLQIPDFYVHFLNALPLYLETEHYYLVHAGFNFSKASFLQDENWMLNTKSYEVDISKTKGKKVINGHLPHSLENIIQIIHGNENAIKIDAGCVYYKNEGLGNLIAFDLDTKDIMVQKNIDLPYPVKLKGFN